MIHRNLLVQSVFHQPPRNPCDSPYPRFAMFHPHAMIVGLISLAALGTAQTPIRILTLDSTRDTICSTANQDLNIGVGAGYTRVREILSDPNNFGWGGLVNRPIEFLPQVPSFTPEALLSADLVLTNGAIPRLTQCESETLANFVLQGGGVFAFHNSAAETPGVAFGGVISPSYNNSGNATISNASSPIVNGPFGTIVAPLYFPFHGVFADLGPYGQAVLSTTGPLCAMFTLGLGKAVIIGDEEWCNNAPGGSTCGFGWLPNLIREMLFMNSVAAVVPDISFLYVPENVCLPTLGTEYCLTATINSTGLQGRIRAEGDVQATSNDVTLIAEQLPTNAFGIFLASEYQGHLFPVRGSQGALCLGGFIGRFVGPGEVQYSGSLGSFQLGIDLNSIPTSLGFESVSAGETWNFQAWHRDLNPTPTSNFTNGVSITFN